MNKKIFIAIHLGILLCFILTGVVCEESGDQEPKKGKGPPPGFKDKLGKNIPPPKKDD